MNYKIEPERGADFQQKLYREPLEGKNAAGEEQDMYAIFDASPLVTPQRSVSLLGWSLAFVTGALLWMLIFYLV
jgi:hypothetical protein